MTLKELQERKNALATKVQELAKRFNDQGQKWKDAEERANWEKVNKDYDEVNAQVAAAKDANDVASRSRSILDAEGRSVNDGLIVPGREDSRYSRPFGQEGESQGFTDAQYRTALNGWCRGQQYATAQQREAMRVCGLEFAEQSPYLSAEDHGMALFVRALQRGGVVTRHYVPAGSEERYVGRRSAGMAEIQARMSGVTGSTGGYLIRPSTLNSQLEVNMLAYGGMRQVAEMLVTETGEPFEWPTFDDTANTGSQVGEGSVGDATDPTIGKVGWNSYNITSGVLKVPFTLLRDAIVDLVGVIDAAIGERIGRRSNTVYTNGHGGNQAKGIMVAASSGVTTASPTAIVFGEIMALIHSIDPSYRQMGCGFMSHDNILLAIRQLVDSQNRPLYVSGLVDGMPDTILGFPHTPNQDMDSAVTATKKTLLFGLLSRYKIRRVGGPRLYRMEERYRDEDKTGFVGFVSEDGNLLDAGTKPVKYITQHS